MYRVMEMFMICFTEIAICEYEHVKVALCILVAIYWVLMLCTRLSNLYLCNCLDMLYLMLYGNLSPPLWDVSRLCPSPRGLGVGVHLQGEVLSWKGVDSIVLTFRP